MCVCVCLWCGLYLYYLEAYTMAKTLPLLSLDQPLIRCFHGGFEAFPCVSNAMNYICIKRFYVGEISISESSVDAN